MNIDLCNVHLVSNLTATGPDITPIMQDHDLIATVFHLHGCLKG
jgi:hypothetical protein